MPERLSHLQENFNDADGNPIIDDEGGAVIQPNQGFVIKTKDSTGQKIFINMTYHDLVDKIEEKSVTAEDAAKYGTSERGVRIPLSLGAVREDNDKKGEPVQVMDFIFATDTIKLAQKDASFRQQIAELAFTYIKQKFDKDLDYRFTVPKMKYKGSTVQYQRIKAKKAPKI